MQLDPTFISTYANAALMYPDNYSSKTAYTFSCFDSCLNCPLNSKVGCQIVVQLGLSGFKISPLTFEQTYVAPLLRQSYPELFV